MVLTAIIKSEPGQFGKGWEELEIESDHYSEFAYISKMEIYIDSLDIIDIEEQIELWCEIGEHYLFKRDFELGHIAVNKLLKFCRRYHGMKRQQYLIRAYNMKGNFYWLQQEPEKALRFFQFAKRELTDDISPEMRGIIENNIGAIYWLQSMFNISLFQFEQALEFHSQENNPTRDTQRMYHYNIAFISVLHRNFEKAEEHLNSAIHKDNSTYFKTYILNLQGEMSIYKNAYGDAKEFLLKAETLVKDTAFEVLKAEIYSNLAYLCQIQNIKELEEEYLTLAETIARSISDKYVITKIYYTRSRFLINRFEFLEAAELLHKALDLMQEVGNPYLDQKILRNLGVSYHHQGKYEQALFYYQASKEINLRVNNIIGLSINYSHLGALEYDKGNIEQASSFTLDSINLLKSKNSIQVSELVNNYFNLIYYTREVDQEKARLYLEEFRGYLNEDPYDIEKRWISGMEALIEIKSSKTTVRASGIYKIINLIEAKEIDQISRLIYLEEVITSLLNDLIPGDTELTDELEQYIDILFTTAKKSQSIYYLTEAYFYKARFELILERLDKAKEALIQAQLLSSEKSYSGLAKAISSQVDDLLQKAEEWTNLIEDSTPIPFHQFLKLHDTFHHFIGKKNKEAQKREKPLTLLIITEHGVNFHSVHFDQEFASNFNEHLTANFFTAIKDLGNNVFSVDGEFKRLYHENFSSVFEKIGNNILVYVFKGESYRPVKLIKKLKESLVAQSSINFSTILHSLTHDQINEIDNIVYKSLKIERSSL